MKTTSLLPRLRALVLLLALPLSAALHAQVEITPPRHITSVRTTPTKPRPTKPRPVKRCTECGNLLAKCSYKGQHPRENGHPYVDLGLPSGTLWATYNVGATAPEQYGQYFAWAETTPKSTYTYQTCRYWLEGEDYKAEFSKYELNDEELDLADDAARANWGGKWRMPSTEQIRELLDRENCEWDWSTINGKRGCLVTSKRNGNSLFLPAAGEREGETLKLAGEYGRYWSRSRGNMNCAAIMYFVDPNYQFADRYEGHSVRPVLE